MPLIFVRNDLTKMKVDAIVNPSNKGLRQGRGTSRAVFLGAGEEELTRACRSLGSCEEGKAVITEGFGLPARYIIHAVCPRWWGGMRREREKLTSAYRSALAVAKAHQLKTVAFPLLSAGSYGYPKKDAVKVAVEAIGSFLMEEDMTVYLVFYDRASIAIGRKLSASVREYIDDHYVEEREKTCGPVDGEEEREGYGGLTVRLEEAPWPETEELPSPPSAPAAFSSRDARPRPCAQSSPQPPTRSYAPPSTQANAQSPARPHAQPPAQANAQSPTQTYTPPPTQANAPTYTQPSIQPYGQPPARAYMPSPPQGSPQPLTQPCVPPRARLHAQPYPVRDRKLEDLLKNVDETFSQMLLRLIDERGLKDSVVYRKANIDRRLFSKIRNDPDHMPTKKTVLAFAVALELSLDETRDLLMKAGYAFSNSSRSDIILSYFIENRRYDIFEINEVLFSYQLPLLGGG